MIRKRKLASICLLGTMMLNCMPVWANDNQAVSREVTSCEAKSNSLSDLMNDPMNTPFWESAKEENGIRYTYHFRSQMNSVSQDIVSFLSQEENIKNIFSSAGYDCSGNIELQVMGLGNYKYQKYSNDSGVIDVEFPSEGMTMDFMWPIKGATGPCWGWVGITEGDPIYVLSQSKDGKWQIAESVMKKSENNRNAFSVFVSNPSTLVFLRAKSNGATIQLQKKQEPSISKVEMYRLYNPNSGEHFYTADTEEKNRLVGYGWQYEGIGWNAPSESNIPVHRLYNPNAGDHHYTIDLEEKVMLEKEGWNYEGIGWYSENENGVPLYRQYNPNAQAGSHNYTTDKAENDKLVSLGWHEEGIGWYGMKGL